MVEDVVVKKFTFAISSPEQFLVMFVMETCRLPLEVTMDATKVGLNGNNSRLHKR